MTTESVAQPTPWAEIDVTVIGATPGQERRHRKTRTWWCSGASARYGLPVTGLGFNASCPARLQPIRPSASSRLQPHSVSLDDQRGGAMAACECRGMSGIAFTASCPSTQVPVTVYLGEAAIQFGAERSSRMAIAVKAGRLTEIVLRILRRLLQCRWRPSSQPRAALRLAASPSASRVRRRKDTPTRELPLVPVA